MTCRLPEAVRMELLPVDARRDQSAVLRPRERFRSAVSVEHPVAAPHTQVHRDLCFELDGWAEAENEALPQHLSQGTVDVVLHRDPADPVRIPLELDRQARPTRQEQSTVFESRARAILELGAQATLA